MANMNIFNNSAFSAMSLTGMVQKVPFVPSLLGSLGIFEPIPVRTRDLYVERRSNELKLIPVSDVGAPPDPLDRAVRDVVSLRTVRLAKRDVLHASEIDGVRAFGMESELESMQAEVARRTAMLRADMEATHEFHRFGAIQGRILDADGVSVVRDYFADFGITPAPSVSITLSSTTANLRKEISAVVREITVASGGAILPTTRIHALAGDEFFDALVTHPQVERTYLNYVAAAELRGGTMPFGTFDFGGVVWHNYRGTDDGSSIAIPANQAKLFPVGARDVFKVAYAPHQSMDFIGTPGQETYLVTIPDRERNMYVALEMYSYPLYICQRPDLLRTLTAG